MSAKDSEIAELRQLLSRKEQSLTDLEAKFNQKVRHFVFSSLCRFVLIAVSIAGGTTRQAHTISAAYSPAEWHRWRFGRVNRIGSHSRILKAPCSVQAACCNYA